MKFPVNIQLNIFLRGESFDACKVYVKWWLGRERMILVDRHGTPLRTVKPPLGPDHKKRSLKWGLEMAHQFMTAYLQNPS